jgi:glycosyltransferase involved in cell wall biosynthesis
MKNTIKIISIILSLLLAIFLIFGFFTQWKLFEKYKMLQENLHITPLKHIENHFVIFVPYCNVYKEYIIECLESIKNQTYQNFEIIFINDGSKHLDFIIDYVKDNLEGKFKLIHYKKNKGPAFTKWAFINYLKENNYNRNNIALIVDGDDSIRKNTLEILNFRYNQTKCWMTFGEATGTFCQESRKIANNDIEYENMRLKKWCANHPRSFKIGLLTYFVENDFKYKKEWLKKCTDRSLVYDSLERSGNNKIQHINTLLYNYREHDNNSHKKVKNEYKKKVLKHILTQPKQEKIQDDIHIVMCCWKRIFNLEKQVQNLTSQTCQNNIHFHLLNNNRSNQHTLNEMVKTFKNYPIKIHLSHYDNQYYGFQRFLYIKDVLLKNYLLDYVVIIDDDQIFPINWLEKLWKMRHPQIYGCWYGKSWYQTCDYWNSSIVSYNDLVNNLNKEKTKFHYGGTGGSIIDTSIFNEDSFLWNIPTDLPKNVSIYNIEDLWLSFIIIYYYNWTIQRTFLLPIINRDNETETVALYKTLIDQKQQLIDYIIKKYKWLCSD